MADMSPLAGLCDRASKVFSLAGQLGEIFQEKANSRAASIDPSVWAYIDPFFQEFCSKLLDFKSEIVEPEVRSLAVSECLREAAEIARAIRVRIDEKRKQPKRQLAYETAGSMLGVKNPGPTIFDAYVDYYQRLKSVADRGRLAIDHLRSLDDHFEFLDKASNEGNEKVADEVTAREPEDFPALSLLKIFTNGVSDDRIVKATALLANDNLTANEKLTNIDAMIRFPPTASAEQLGELLGVTKQAISKTDWWDQNRKGEKYNEIGRREAKFKKRSAGQEMNEDEN